MQSRYASALRYAMPFLTLLACSSAVEPLPVVTLQVTNATCNPGPCQAIRVLAFPQNAPITPAGGWSLDLGVVTSATACIALPSVARFTVTDAGTGVVTTTTWTIEEPFALASWPPSGARFTAGPTTPAFVAANGRSWSATLPGTAAPVVTPGCVP